MEDTVHTGRNEHSSRLAESDESRSGRMGVEQTSVPRQFKMPRGSSHGPVCNIRQLKTSENPI